MNRFFLIFPSLVFIITFSSIGFGQTSDTTATTTEEVGDFVDLTGEAVRITIEPEKPRVNIIADRIKPEFDMMNMQRSFRSELTGSGEKIVVADPKARIKNDKIDVNKILNRSR
jgi:hypothetical protein